MFTAKEIIEATGATPLGVVSDPPFDGISQHSKTIKENEVFIAIIGERLDGHQFLKEIFGKGVRAAIVKKGMIKKNDFPNKLCFEVQDTTKALGDLARFHRLRSLIPILGITGSNGKTTTKDLIFHILKTQYKILKTLGNKNNLVGLPFSLFRLDSKYEFAVLELGISLPHEMKRLSEITNPTGALITNIGDTHLEFMRSRANIAKIKGNLFKALPAEGVAFVNIDDRYLQPYATSLRCNIRTYSLKDENADVFGKILADKSLEGLDLNCIIKNKGKSNAMTIHLHLPGKHNASNAIAAIAVASYYGVRPDNIKQALESFQATEGRSRMVTLKPGLTLVDDSYNANPSSMVAAIQLLSACKHEKPSPSTYAVLGDMLELGMQKDKYHQELGRLIARSKIDNLLTFGPLSRYIKEIAEVENKELKASWTLDQKELIHQLIQKLSSESAAVILVKGSHGLRMDRVVEALIETKEI